MPRWTLRDGGVLRAAVIRRDLFRCVMCNASGYVTGLDIHHADPKGMGGSKILDHPENLVSLCRTCHDTAHRDIPRWRPRLQAIAARSMPRFTYP